MGKWEFNTFFVVAARLSQKPQREVVNEKPPASDKNGAVDKNIWARINWISRNSCWVGTEIISGYYGEKGSFRGRKRSLESNDVVQI